MARNQAFLWPKNGETFVVNRLYDWNLCLDLGICYLKTCIMEIRDPQKGGCFQRVSLIFHKVCCGFLKVT